MEINIPSAAEARATVAQCKYDRAQKQLRAVEAAVIRAIQNGSQQASYAGYLDAPVVAALTAKGYKVDQGSCRNEDYCTITW